jgi:hypothetical protein
MTRIETVVPNPIPGAGRFFDFVWPAINNYLPAANISARNQLAAPTGAGVAFVSFGGGVANTAAMWKGVPIISVNCSAVAGNGNATELIPARVLLNTTRNALAAINNDILCWRIIWNAATFVAPANTGEVGLYLITDQNTPKIVTGTSSGFGFRFFNDGSVGFTTITGGLATTTTLKAVASGYDLTDVHSYELRLFGATANADANLEVLIDNVTLTALLPATSKSWAAGTKLPPTQLTGANLGFIPTAVAMANVASGLFVNQMRVIAGPTLDSLF